MKKIFLLAAIALLGGSVAAQTRNIIYIVGDGMGVAHVTASLMSQKGKSQFLRFPITGFSQTYSLDNYTTDSGAGGTALFTGRKVQNQHIAFGPNGEHYPSVLFRAHEMGKSTGFVVTSDVLDATPASTYAHVSYRRQYDSISLQMSQCPFDVMIGGDYNHFVKKNRKDGKAPLDTLKRRGYHISTTLKDMKEYKDDKLVALLTPDKPKGAPDREPILTEGVSKALELLSRNDKGFMLMVEGSQIDWANHANDSAQLTAELAEFEEMLRIVLDFAQRDGNTLVVVTADHESGGLVLLDGSVEKGVNQYQFNTKHHSASMVPVFAYGPQSNRFSGIHQNTEVHDIILNIMSRQERSSQGRPNAGSNARMMRLKAGSDQLMKMRQNDSTGMKILKIGE